MKALLAAAVLFGALAVPIVPSARSQEKPVASGSLPSARIGMAQHEAMRGDADCSGAVNSGDALWVLQYVVRNVAFLPCPQAADSDGDGVVTAVDALLDLQLDAGLIGALP